MASIQDMIIPTLAVLLGAVGTYLMLPLRHGEARPGRVYLVGSVLAAVGLLGVLAAFLRPPGPFLTGLFFIVFSAGAIFGGVLTVTSRSPIDSALWFAAVILATTGLFLLAGASFLAAGTVIVYAGAVIVTFLFVIMLAQMEGKAVYDRASRSPGSSTFTCFLLFWCLIYSLTALHAGFTAEGGKILVPPTRIAKLFPTPKGFPMASLLESVNRPTLQFNDVEGKPKPHVAGLGETLYTDHLITVELVGALLFVALIGAVAIINPKPPVRPGDPRRNAPANP